MYIVQCKLAYTKSRRCNRFRPIFYICLCPPVVVTDGV